MEQSTLGFFIGIQNLCIEHNKTITSMQWIGGNLFMLLSLGISIWFFVAIRKKVLLRKFKKVVIGYWGVAILFFLGFNVVSLSLPIDEREAMEEVLREKPQIAHKVRNEIATLKALGKNEVR